MVTTMFYHFLAPEGGHPTMICFLPTVMPVTLHFGNLKVIDITLKMKKKKLSIMNNKSWHSLRILNDGRSAL